MPKIYFKTIVLVVAAVILIALRLNQLFHFLMFATPSDIDVLLDLGIVMSITAIILNEKFTRGEHWRLRHYFVLLLIAVLFIWIRQALHNTVTAMLFLLSILPSAL